MSEVYVSYCSIKLVVGVVIGIGALYVRRRPRVRVEPIQSGGGQERNIRSGTVPAPLCVGLGEACRLAMQEKQVTCLFMIYIIDAMRVEEFNSAAVCWQQHILQHVLTSARRCCEAAEHVHSMRQHLIVHKFLYRQKHFIYLYKNTKLSVIK